MMFEYGIDTSEFSEEVSDNCNNYHNSNNIDMHQLSAGSQQICCMMSVILLWRVCVFTP